MIYILRRKKLIKINFSLDVIHDHALGWDYSTGEWRGGRSASRFPYDFGLLRDTTDTPSAGVATFNDAPAGNAATSPPPPPGSTAANVAQKEVDDVSGAGVQHGVGGEVMKPTPP